MLIFIIWPVVYTFPVHIFAFNKIYSRYNSSEIRIVGMLIQEGCN